MQKFLLPIACLALSACVTTPSKHLHQEASAHLLNNDGDVIGHAHFTQAAHGVLIKVAASDLSPGKHGLHLHGVGSCADHDHFKSAGPHMATDSQTEHGLLSPSGGHAGDLPNLFVHKTGKAAAEFFTQSVTLYPEDHRPALFDKDGSSLMIHASNDDHITQPGGTTGARAACGVIRGNF